MKIETGWTVDDSTFAARLALIRFRMGWNVKEAARECGFPDGNWRTWEMDGREPRQLLATAQKIADRTGCDFTWLVAGPPKGLGRTTSHKHAVTERALCANPRSPRPAPPTPTPARPEPCRPQRINRTRR